MGNRQHLKKQKKFSHFSINQVCPLIYVDKLFRQIRTNLFPLDIIVGTALPTPILIALYFRPHWRNKGRRKGSEIN